MVAFGQFLEILIGGLLAGVLYSLVALGFVLIFKASGVFNFAQGAMVLLAGLALVRSLDFMAASGVPMWAAIVLGLMFAALIMAISAWLIERFVLGPLVNQDGLTLFMSTIGATFIIEGAAQLIFGSDVYPLRFLPSNTWFLFENMFPGGILVNQLDVVGGLIAGVLVAGLAIFFQKTKTGRALRAVADDHAAAQSVGIPIAWIWFVVWLVAGLVALVAATIWGTKLGVQFSITFLALKALPVLIIGGFTSVPGAIVGGLVVGAGEKLAEAYLGPHMGGGIEYWFAYVLALAVLLARPQGLFGERIIERIEELSVLYREAGQFKTSYSADMAIFPIRQDRIALYLLLAFAFFGVPLMATLHIWPLGSDYFLRAILIPFLILALATIGMNILVGYCGQISLGGGAFMAIGAYSAYKFTTGVHLPIEWLGTEISIAPLPVVPSILLGGLMSAAVGILFGIPSLRIKGLYLAVATLAAQFFFDWVFIRIKWFTNYNPSGSVAAPDLSFFGLAIDTSIERYLFCLVFVTIFAFLAKNLVRGNLGRQWMAIRDMDIAAELMGIRPFYAKLTAFAVSSFIVGVAGALWAFVYLGAWEPLAFDINRSFQLLFMVIIGGLGSILGSFLGAAFILILPILLDQVPHALGIPISVETVSLSVFIVTGALICYLLIVEPHGFAKLWSTGKEKLRLWPYPY